MALVWVTCGYLPASTSAFYMCEHLHIRRFRIIPSSRRFFFIIFILLYKLQASGLNNNLISWIQDFLNNRKQFVTVNGQFSKLFKVLSGIPQGSVLGPILFLIYINDLPDFCLGKHDANCDIYLYADDAKLYKTITNGEDQDILQRVINRLKEWCDRWLVSININKCSQMSSKA